MLDDEYRITAEEAGYVASALVVQKESLKATARYGSKVAQAEVEKVTKITDRALSKIIIQASNGNAKVARELAEYTEEKGKEIRERARALLDE